MKKYEMINVNFMEIVHEICTTTSTDCRSLNKSDLARKLMDLVNIPQNAEIQEIPLDWEDQVDVCFTIPNDDNCYSLYAGHLSIAGRLSLDGETIEIDTDAVIYNSEGYSYINNDD